MKYLIVLFMVSFGLSQTPLSVKPFNAADTIGSITSIDSVYVQMGSNGQWKLLTKAVNDTALITADDKSAEQGVTFMLAREDYWTHANSIRFRILSTGVDTIESNWQNVGTYRGAFTLDVFPDTVGTNTFYGETLLHGN